jgi:hypothetical protein
MRIQGLFLLLALAVLAAGCGKRTPGGYSESPSKPGKGKQLSMYAERSFPADSEPLKDALANFMSTSFAGGFSDIEFLAISEPFKVKQRGGTAQAYWVQYTATDSLANRVLRHHELFIVRDGKIIDQCRTKQEIRDKFGTRFADDHLPPAWPDPEPPRPKKE